MRSVDREFEELEAILREESDAHEMLLAAAKEVNVAAGKGDLAALRRHTAVLDRQAAGIERLDARRKACCAAIGKIIKLPPGAVRLSTVTEHAPPRLRGVIAARGASLTSTMTKIAAVNAGNSHLCEAGIRFARGRLHLILQSVEKYRGYRAGGNRCAAGLPVHPFINRTV
jgi:hypothetical protein